MNKAGKIVSINPPRAIPGGEVFIECENFKINSVDDYGCFFNGQRVQLRAASANRFIAIVPGELQTTDVSVHLESSGDKSDPAQIVVGKKLADGLHIVANPAVDPQNDSLILTRSGTRGQKLPVTLLRLEKSGYLNEMPVDIMNPTAVAFDKIGQLFVTARADGEVWRINMDEEGIPYASELGIATGLAFDKNGGMFVGDRSGTIYRIDAFGNPESFAVLEPSVSAYHMAFGPDDKLYVTAPGLSSFDAVYAIDKSGYEKIFYRGLGRPQGLAFDRDGNLYTAACLEGRHGIVKIASSGKNAEIFVAGTSVIGLCMTREGEMIVATNDSIYSLPVEIYGTLL